jgi:hypothetical protein
MYAVLMAVLLLLPSDSKVDGRQFMAMLEGLHSDIHDFELVWEGQLKYADSAPDLQKGGPKNIECIFQGSYAYRARDGAAYYDLYQKPFDASAPFLHATHAQLKGKHTKLVLSSNQKRPPGFAEESSGGPASFRFPNSPERIEYLSYWRRCGYSTARIGYECEGWDEIDGYPVLRIAIHESPSEPSSYRKLSRLWVDMARGGHVLKHDFYVGSELWWRVHNVKLAPMPLGSGKEVWFPIYGEHDSFLWGTGCRTTPALHETNYLVRGSLVFNKGLADERFSLDWEGHKAKPEPLRGTAREFDLAAPSLPPPPPVRTDPAGVQEDQERRLAEADRQARQLDASPPARRGWDLAVLTQASFAFAGIGALISVFILRLRAAGART